MMNNEDDSFIGKVSDVSGGHLIATLLTDAEGFKPYVQMGLEEVAVGQVSSYVLIKSKGLQLMTQVSRMWQESIDSEIVKRIELQPLGNLSSDLRFTSGISQYPVLGAEVYMVTTHQLESMFDSFRKDGLHLGRVSQHQELKVYFQPGNLFTRHLAILGQSGSGKSWTVASILQRTVKLMPKSHVVVLDLHGEYGWRDEDGKMHSTFPNEMVRHIDARELEIPYWLLTYAELIDLLIDRTDANASIQIAFMREVLHNLRRKANFDLGVDGLSVDSPVFFSIKEMYLQFKKANEQQLDFGKSKGPLFGMFDEFLVRFQSMYNDSRYDFLFKPKKRTESEDLEALLRDFIGLAKPKRQITVIDMSSVPHDVRPTISAQIGRLAFEFNYWNPQRHEFPILLVCEEAHQYIPRESDTQHQGTRKAMERIAKEGRKYGVGLCIVSQRPAELSETVLSQCANFICLRMTNPDDQNYIKRLTPDSEHNITDTLPSLRRGEALAMGEAVALPTRFQVYTPEPPPSSHDAPLTESWKNGPDDIDVSKIVSNWWNQKR